MQGFRRLFFAALTAFSLRRSDRHMLLARRWSARAFEFNRKAILPEREQ